MREQDRMEPVDAAGSQRLLARLPHAFPMRLVDRVLAWEPGRAIRAVKYISQNEPCLPGHFPEQPIMPGVLMLEALTQAGALALMGETDDPDTSLYLLQVRQAKFVRWIVPGDAVVIEAEVLETDEQLCKVSAAGTVDGAVAVKAEISYIRAPAPGKVLARGREMRGS